MRKNAKKLFALILALCMSLTLLTACGGDTAGSDSGVGESSSGGETITWRLQSSYSLNSLQGDMAMSERQAAMRRFKDGQADMLLATDVAARGLDIPEISHVYNFDLPANAAIYVHRAGRTARAGANGIVVSLVLASEISTLEKIERYTSRNIERRAIKNLCAKFPENPGIKHQSEKKRSRVNIGGGFDKRHKDEEKRRKPKERLRDRKNKGKPDFAAKRARKAAIIAKNEQK